LSRIGSNIITTVIGYNSDNFVGISVLTRDYSVEDVHNNPEFCPGADLIFEQEEDDFVIVTRQSFIPDIRLGEEEEILDGDSVLCLLLGTSEIKWAKGARTMALCLVLMHSTNREGAFERIGVMMCDPDSRIFRLKEDRVIELV
jgi:hypothetical protein